jgi:hypothetical protein
MATKAKKRGSTASGSKTPPWKRKRPGAAGHAKLSPAWRAKARARARAAGRNYPNLIDNMWAARLQKRTAGSR